MGCFGMGVNVCPIDTSLTATLTKIFSVGTRRQARLKKIRNAGYKVVSRLGIKHSCVTILTSKMNFARITM